MAGLTRAFFARATDVVAHDLLGMRLARIFPDGRRVIGRIVETEAYPPGDLASHAFGGPTSRNASMFGRPATAYVYLIYGVHWCVNVVTEPSGVGAAILVRGLDGVDGCAGPGRLCRELDIDGRLDGADLLARFSPIRLFARAGPVAERSIATTRIGITRAVDEPLRFYLLGSPGVSRR
jgi:DNA-3-methyladenine glycosylase